MNAMGFGVGYQKDILFHARQIEKARTTGRNNFLFFWALGTHLPGGMAEASDNLLRRRGHIHSARRNSLHGRARTRSLIPKNNIFVYCLLELGIGVFGIVSPAFLNFFGQPHRRASYAQTFVYSFAFLSVPTFLMA
jgi:hypothetical protein